MHCPSRGEHVTVTRTLSRVVDRVEAYIFNNMHETDAGRREGRGTPPPLRRTMYMCMCMYMCSAC
jgi:hypothetical protein